MTSQDEEYLDILLDPIETCKAYDPKFGQSSAVSLADFHVLYGTDPFYSWLGLDNPLLYAAHKASGGITSLYRQLGIGSERLFRRVLRDQLGLSEDEVNWSYTVTTGGGRASTLALDGRIELEHVADKGERERVREWVTRAAAHLDVDDGVAAALKGAVFEVRQAYKSKDSKRQNADIENYLKAYTKGYLPVVLLMSTQIDGDVAARYESAGCLLLRGSADRPPFFVPAGVTVPTPVHGVREAA